MLGEIFNSSFGTNERMRKSLIFNSSFGTNERLLVQNERAFSHLESLFETNARKRQSLIVRSERTSVIRSNERYLVNYISNEMHCTIDYIYIYIYIYIYFNFLTCG